MTRRTVPLSIPLRPVCLAAAAFASIVAAVLGAGPAAAQDQNLLGRYGDWEAFTQGEGASKVCYMVAKPQEASLRSRRGDIFFLVNHWPGRKEFDVVQVDIGYTFKERSEAEVSIGSDTWKLFTQGGNAWTYKPQDDAALVAAIRKGSRMTVKGTSSRDNPTADRYSLKGTSAAHEAIDKACGR
jgi:invasion protein IalB